MSIFDTDSLKQQVERALANDIPPGHRGALIATASLDGTVEVRYAHRVNDTWTLGAVAYKRPKEKLAGLFEVRATW